MSLELVPRTEPVKIYLITYEMRVPEDSGKAILPIVAHKATELEVCGYIAYTHCGRKVGGELEGTETGLRAMVEWLLAKSQGNGDLGDGEKIKSQMTEPRFSKWKLQSGAKYDDFFCC
ncbi:uncharacterized protein [Drosophila suzukii]|uniref:Uncharacterized protein n=1 Tax=Drosophila suzukii TaxID=28584 RepID=A0AB39ZEX5_DROSZ